MQPVSQTMKKARALLCVLLLLGAAACAGEQPEGVLTKATGPARVDQSAVAEHADQFDTEIPQRPAGSQQEEIATSYLLAHLQQAGYLVRLDAVPVKDLVRSTNVVAPPPSGEDPTVVLAVAYDTGPGETSDGAALGLWLELARALNVKDPNHSVAFVALGANDFVDAPGFPLGERRLAAFMEGEGWEPSVIQLLGTGEAEVGGAAAKGLVDPASSLLLGKLRHEGPDPLTDSGFPQTYIRGPADALGPLLLRYLSARS